MQKISTTYTWHGTLANHGIPASKYYLDQTEAFIRGEYFRKAWKKEDVVATARYTTLLLPAR